MLTSNLPIKGMNKDVHPKFQDEQSYRFALNASLETIDGNIGALSNELGNIECINIPSGKKIIGHCLTNTEDVILALFDENGEHEFGLFNPMSCEYTTVAIGNCLNFSLEHQLNILFRIRNGCERVLYFTDNYNEYRVINITQTEDWLDPDTLQITDCYKIQFDRDFTIPCATLLTDGFTQQEIDWGGQLEFGTYTFACRYLDVEENATDWALRSNPIAIGYKSFKALNTLSSTYTYTGASNNPDEPGYQPKTNKSIGLTFSNVDTRFKFLQIAVIKRTSSTGNISSVDLLFPVPIESSQLNFIYTGFDSQIKTTSTIDDILAERQPVYKVKAHTQIDNRLLIGNITNKNRNYAVFQRHASKIKTEYVKVPVVNINNRARKPAYYFGDNSFLSDEVYALGIVYVFKDGSISPVFHIPGRAANTVTGSNPLIPTFTNWDTDDITGDVNIYNTAKHTRWQVYNTATKYSTPISGTSVSGLMGYYECNETYPDIDPTCDTHPDGYWGRDWQGNLITSSTKIRHHKMPGAELTHATTIEHYRIGINFTISDDYPDEEIVNHYFVYGDRTFEKTVADKGLLFPLKEYIPNSDKQLLLAGLFKDLNPGPAYGNHMTVVPADTHRSYAFLSPQTLFDGTYSSGTYVRVDKYLTSPSGDFGSITGPVGFNSQRYGKVTNMDLYLDNYTKYITPSMFNYAIDNSVYLEKSEEASNGNTAYLTAENKTVLNTSSNNSWLILSLKDKLSMLVVAPATGWDQHIFQVSIKNDLDVFANLFNINYIKIGNCPLTKYEGVTQSYKLYDGDTFASRLGITDWVFVREGDGDTLAHVNYCHALVECDYMNPEFRHGDFNSEGKYSFFQWSYGFSTQAMSNLGEYLADKYYENVAGEDSHFYPETYLYNKSYSYIEPIERFYPLPFNFEYCNDCREDFPYRMYNSQVDNIEEKEDKYRIIYPNNYKDLDGYTGEINDMFINFNKIYSVTDSSIYHIPARTQQLITNENSLYIGTGEFFSLPSEQLKITDYQFGGSRFFKSRVTTEYGTAYIDDFSGRPFLLTNQLSDISLNGMRNFWQENGTLQLDLIYYKNNGTHYPNISTSSKNGVGYMTTYDPRFKRLIIHKKDYKPLTHFEASFQYYPTNPKPANTITFDGQSFWFTDKLGTSSEIYLDDIRYFENKSFTISYSFVTNSWVSFHSYLPYYALNNFDTFYSANNDILYKHNYGDYQTYYGTKYNYEVDLIAKNSPAIQEQYSNVFISATGSLFDTTKQTYRYFNDIFDKAIFYNDTQTTGNLLLKLKQTAFDTDNVQGQALVSPYNKRLSISNIRDRVSDYTLPIWDSSWDVLKSTPFNYQERVPNESNLHSASFLQSRLKDFYIGMKLTSNKPDNLKITTDIINTRYENRNL